LVAFPRHATRSPHAATVGPSVVDRREQRAGVTALDSVEEVRRRRTAADKLDVHVQAADTDIPQQASVAVHVIESAVALELDPPTRRREVLELTERLPCIAFPLAELRRVDLHEPNSRAARELERVAVADARDRNGPILDLGL
jgi:hypothetical protein